MAGETSSQRSMDFFVSPRLGFAWQTRLTSDDEKTMGFSLVDGFLDGLELGLLG